MAPPGTCRAKTKAGALGGSAPAQHTDHHDTSLNDGCKNPNSISPAGGKTELFFYPLNRKLNFEIVIMWRTRDMQPKKM